MTHTFRARVGDVLAWDRLICAVVTIPMLKNTATAQIHDRRLKA